MSTNMLTLQGIAAGYGQIQILRSVSIAVAAGEVTALIGGNGAGKTTIMRTIAGVLPLKAGRLLFDGQDIGAWPANRRVDAGLVLVPEGRLVFPNMSVEENLRVGAIAPRARSRASARRDEMYDMFPRLRERRNQRAGTMSGGEQQMLAIARGLMAYPKLLLMDEPTLGLAPVMTKEIFATIARLRDLGVTILLAEQDVRQTLAVADRGHVVENGAVTLSGSGAALAGDERVREAYLGI